MTDAEPPGGLAGRRGWGLRRQRYDTAPPGGVPEGHPGRTPRVLEAIEAAQRARRAAHIISDADGPHAHQWQAILWWCRGCGAVEDETP